MYPDFGRIWWRKEWKRTWIGYVTVLSQPQGNKTYIWLTQCSFHSEILAIFTDTFAISNFSRLKFFYLFLSLHLIYVQILEVFSYSVSRKLGWSMTKRWSAASQHQMGLIRQICHSYYHSGIAGLWALGSWIEWISIVHNTITTWWWYWWWWIDHRPLKAVVGFFHSHFGWDIEHGDSSPNSLSNIFEQHLVVILSHYFNFRHENVSQTQLLSKTNATMMQISLIAPIMISFLLLQEIHNLSVWLLEQ